jgi:hypothetical protein
MGGAAEKAPSILLQRADAVHRCVKELERENHAIQGITITDSEAIVMLKTSGNCKKLLARECGTINTPKGRFTVMQLKLYGVYVQWLRPFFVVEVKPSSRPH